MSLDENIELYVNESFENYKKYLRSWKDSSLRYKVDEIWDLINIVAFKGKYNIAFLSFDKYFKHQVRFKSTVLDKNKPIILVYEQSPEVFFLLTDKKYKPLANKNFREFLYEKFPVNTNGIPSLVELINFIGDRGEISIQYQIRNSNGQAIRLGINNIEIPCRPSACQPEIPFRSADRIELPQVADVVALLKEVDRILMENSYEFQYNEHLKYTPDERRKGNYNGILIDDIYFIECAPFTMDTIENRYLDKEPFIYDGRRIDLDIQYQAPVENKLHVFMKEITTTKDIFFDYYNAIKINMTIAQKCDAIQVLYNNSKQKSRQLTFIIRQVPNIFFLKNPTENIRFVKKIDEEGKRTFHFINVDQDKVQSQLIQDILVNLLSRQYIFNPQYLLVYKS